MTSVGAGHPSLITECRCQLPRTKDSTEKQEKGVGGFKNEEEKNVFHLKSNLAGALV